MRYAIVLLALVCAGCLDDTQDQDCGEVYLGPGASITGSTIEIECGPQDADNQPGNSFDADASVDGGGVG